jgi:hypothetical protein
MSQRSELTTRKLIVRSLTPSGASAFLCIVLAALMVGVNIVLQSVSVGTALPGILDGQWSIAYTEHVVQPLTEALSSNALNKLLVAILWGVAGFLVYILIEYVVHTYKGLQESRNNIRMARGNVIERPLTTSFWQAIRWRLGVAAVGVLFLIAIQPILNDALSIGPRIVLSDHLRRDSLRMLLAMVEWAIILHGLVVLMRLYTMRTRLFGDSSLY